MPFLERDDAHTYRFRGNWNEVPGVYGIMNANKQMIYIGETDNVKRRMAEHQADTRHKMHRYGPELVWFETIRTGERARIAREQVLIAEYNPPANA